MSRVTLDDIIDARVDAQVSNAYVAKTEHELNVKDSAVGLLQRAAIGTGVTHPLSSFYASLALAQVDYPHATALTNELDQVVMQKAINTAAVGTTPTYTTTLTDLFTRANSTTTLGSAATGQAWTAVTGTWGINSNQAYQAAPGVSHTAMVESGISDGTFQCDVTYQAEGPGMVFRGLGSAFDDGFVVQLGPTYCAILAPGGATVALGSGPFSAGNTYTCKVVTNGTSIKLYVGGVLKIDTFSDLQLTATKIGLRADYYSSAGQRWDNLSAVSIATPVGGTVFAPAGRYMLPVGASTVKIAGYATPIPNSVKIRSKVRLRGEPGTVFYTPDPTPGSSTSHAVCIADYSGGGETRWKIDGIEFDGGFSVAGLGSVTEAFHQPIWVGPCDKFRVEGCEAYGFRGGFLRMVGETVAPSRVPRHFTVKGNHAHDCHGPGIDFARGAADFFVLGNELYDNVLGAEGIHGPSTATAYRGLIGNNRIISWGDIFLGNAEDVLCHDNFVNGALGGSMIRLLDNERVSILDNILDAGSEAPWTGAVGSGISMFATTKCKRLKINGNTIRRLGAGTGASWSPGIWFQPTLGIASAEVEIDGNTIDDNGAPGVEQSIVIKSIDGPKVTNNICGSILVVGSCTAPIVTGNSCDGAGDRIPLNVQASDGIVNGNRCYAAGTKPALALSGDRMAVGDNWLKSGALFSDGVINNTGNDSVFGPNYIETTAVTSNRRNIADTGLRNEWAKQKLLGGGAVAIDATSSWPAKTGVASVANGGTVTHGMPLTPRSVRLTASAADRAVAVTARGATTFTVSLTTLAGVAVAVAENVYWSAEG